MAQSARSRSWQQSLEQASSPIYVLDANDRVVFLNAACRAWLGNWSDPVIGKANVGDGQAPLDEVLRGLAPPAEVRNGHVASSLVHCPGCKVLAPFRFTPIGSGPQRLILAEAGALPINALLSGEADFAALRDKVLRIRSHQPRIDHWPMLLGENLATVHARRQLHVAANSWAHVLLVGEQGFGGDRIARNLHGLRGEEAGPLAVVDAPLMDAELFDFTAANLLEHLSESRERRATLLLRQVSELPLDAAERLSGWLAQFSGQLRCLSTSSTPFDIFDRVPGSLPRLLMSQLSTLQVRVPGIRHRAEDLPLLAAALLQRRQAAGSKATGFARATLDQLSIYPWPGDYVELEETIRHAARACPQGVVQPDHLPLQIRTWHPNTRSDGQQDRPIDLDRLLQAIETDLIRRALTRSHQNRTDAARQLGISRARLIRRISELNVGDAEPANADGEGES